MAVFTIHINTDLERTLEETHISNAFYTDDALAHEIIVHILRNGQAENVTGTVEMTIIKADGTTATGTGSISNSNQVHCTLPVAAYTCEGPLRIVIKLVTGNVRTTIASCAAYVREG